MRNIKKIVALALGGVMSLGILSGCSKGEVDLYKAFSKSQKITSMTTKTDMSFKLTAKNLSAQEKEIAEVVLPMVNSSSISATTKMSQNPDKTKAKMESNMKMNFANMPLDMTLWVDTDLTGEEMKLKEIIKLPSMVTQMAPEQFAGKEYVSMDYADFAKLPGATGVDLKKVTKFSKELQDKLVKFIGKYAMQFNPKSEIVTYKGTEFIVQPSITQKANIYEIKLDDKGFKELLRYTTTNLAENKDALQFIKEYMDASLQFVTLPAEELAKAKEEMNKLFQDYEKNLPMLIEKINQAFEKLQDVKILGEKGISIQYAVNSDGYIINEKGVADFVLDFSNIAKLKGNEGQDQSAMPTGAYNLTIEYNNDIYDINKNVDIKLPELNEKNSIKYMDLINMLSGVQQGK